MNIASIDVGSNTVLLLIAKIENNKLIPIINLYNSPRLGKDLLPSMQIKEDRIENLIKILTIYKSKILEFNCEKVLIKATNAMRIASNSKEICNKIKVKLNLDIEIIDGNTEAEFSYLGASSSVPNIDEKMVIDVGGGSTEIIFGNSNQIFFKHSFQTGVVSLTERFFKNRPLTKSDIQKAEIFLGNLFESLDKNIPNNLVTIAVAGTPTTLSCIKQNLKDYVEEKVEGSLLTFDEIVELKEKIKKVQPNEMITNFGSVVKGREDVLFAGILILETIMKIKRLDEIFVSGRGLRYGIVINYMNKFKV
jgi:exopolyphosphatase/guanosine-5'-triphosphate,3'-diphosphate pyrophosphatase